MNVIEHFFPEVLVASPALSSQYPWFRFLTERKCQKCCQNLQLGFSNSLISATSELNFSFKSLGNTFLRMDVSIGKNIIFRLFRQNLCSNSNFSINNDSMSCIRNSIHSFISFGRLLDVKFLDF